MSEKNQAGFPTGFVWGAATASYQIEGAVNEDGRGESIWDRFSHTPGKTENGETGDVADDHYHRVDEDIALMVKLGLKAYRFSIAWPRILPQGTGEVNEAGLAFYDSLVDKLLAANITPFITLYHWDLPQALEDQDGWANRATAEAFANYADIVTKRLGNRVKHWITFNEPLVSAFVGYLDGRHAPGRKDRKAAVAAMHHLLVAHGLAVPLIRKNVPDAEVGITLNLAYDVPATDTPEDQDASRKASGRWRVFYDAIFKGSYPADVLNDFGEDQPPVQPGDAEMIAAPLEFVGMNYYFRERHSAAGKPSRLAEITYTEMNWEVYPEGLYNMLTHVNQEYKPRQIYITENGSAFPDTLNADGSVHDPLRVAYLRDHLAASQRAIEAGVPLQGYFAWSLMDNYEWAYGYRPRFGLIYVDYPDGQKRYLKDSALFYKEVIAANALPQES